MPGVHCTESPTPPTSTTAPSGDTAATRPLTLAITCQPLPRGSVRCTTGAPMPPARAAALQPLLSQPAPHLADRQRERIRGVRRASGAAASPSTRVTINVTCSLSARPLPEIAALTSLGVCRPPAGRPARRPARRRPRPARCPWRCPCCSGVKTRSTATTSGRNSRSSAVTAVCSSSSRSSRSSSAELRTTPTPSAVRARAGAALDHAPPAPGQTRVDAEHPHEQPPTVSRTPVRPR